MQYFSIFSPMCHPWITFQKEFPLLLQTVAPHQLLKILFQNLNLQQIKTMEYRISVVCLKKKIGSLVRYKIINFFKFKTQCSKIRKKKILQKSEIWRDNALLASKAKINVFWLFFKWSFTKRGYRGVMKKFQ